MRLNDFLEVLRAEFDSAADDIDAALMAWLRVGSEAGIWRRTTRRRAVR